MSEQIRDGFRHVLVKRLSQHVGQEVLVQGWVHNITSKGKLHFVQVRDGSGIVQAVAFKGNLPEEQFQQVGALTQEASVRFRGKVKAEPRAPGGHELDVTWFALVGASHEFPITPKEHGPAFLMDHRHLWLRSKKQAAIFRIRDEAIKAVRDFFYERDFVCMDSPIFTPNACEGTSTLFEVDYFDEGKAYLTQSGQLYAEASAMALGRVYCFGPTFRAEKSKTRRHLTEFWMIEPEAAFFDIDDVMALAEDFVSNIVKRVLQNRLDDLKILERDVKKLEPATQTPYPRITYKEAVEYFKQRGHPFQDGNDFGAPDETVLGEKYDRPFLVHRWPSAVKAFYMKRDPQDENVVLGVDMIASEGYGEILGGSQREDNLELLLQRIHHQQLPESAFQWYLDLRRFGSVPHGGFGLGLERTLAWITGVEHLRECIPFPRMLYKIYP
jgi:asparaginyl-tRNA synthetase